MPVNGAGERTRPQVAMMVDRFRRFAAQTVLAVYDLGVFLFGSIFQSPTSSELPAAVTPHPVRAGDLSSGLARVTGFARVVVRLGGPTLPVPGHLADGSVPRFVPAPWWLERGAVEQVLDRPPGETAER